MIDGSVDSGSSARSAGRLEEARELDRILRDRSLKKAAVGEQAGDTRRDVPQLDHLDHAREAGKVLRQTTMQETDVVGAKKGGAHAGTRPIALGKSPSGELALGTGYDIVGEYLESMLVPLTMVNGSNSGAISSE